MRRRVNPLSRFLTRHALPNFNINKSGRLTGEMSIFSFFFPPFVLSFHFYFFSREEESSRRRVRAAALLHPARPAADATGTKPSCSATSCQKQQQPGLRVHPDFWWGKIDPNHDTVACALAQSHTDTQGHAIAAHFDKWTHGNHGTVPGVREKEKRLPGCETRRP